MKKKTHKQIAAILGIILLLSLYVVTLVAAIADFEGSDRLFAASMGATIGMPILLWIYMALYSKLTGKKTVAETEIFPDTTPIKTIIFDIGNVLTNFRWKEFFYDKGYSEELVERIGKATTESDAWCEYDRGMMTDEEILESFIANDPGIEKELRESLADIHNIVTKCDYAIPWILELKKKGYQVLYLSNFSHKAETECAEALDFIPYTDGGILSYKEKCIKPDPQIYELLLKRYHLNPAECVFLDDTPRNLEGAQAFGIHTILFQNQKQAEKELKAMGVR